jgi:hypothetical protein
MPAKQGFCPVGVAELQRLIALDDRRQKLWLQQSAHSQARGKAVILRRML